MKKVYTDLNSGKAEPNFARTRMKKLVGEKRSVDMKHAALRGAVRSIRESQPIELREHRLNDAVTLVETLFDIDLLKRKPS